MDIQLGHYLALATLLFGIGVAGFFLRRNILIQLMSIELMLNAANLLFVSFNRWMPENHLGQTYSFFVIAIAAAEAAVGLAIVIGFFRLNKNVDSSAASLLKH